MVGAGVVPRGGQEHGRDILGPLITTLILTSESQLALSDRVLPLRTAPGSTIPRGSTLTKNLPEPWLPKVMPKIFFPIFISGGTHAQICSEQPRERT